MQKIGIDLSGNLPTETTVFVLGTVLAAVGALADRKYRHLQPHDLPKTLGLNGDERMWRKPTWRSVVDAICFGALIAVFVDRTLRMGKLDNAEMIQVLLGLLLACSFYYLYTFTAQKADCEAAAEKLQISCSDGDRLANTLRLLRQRLRIQFQAYHHDLWQPSQSFVSKVELAISKAILRRSVRIYLLRKRCLLFSAIVQGCSARIHVFESYLNGYLSTKDTVLSSLLKQENISTRSKNLADVIELRVKQLRRERVAATEEATVSLSFTERRRLLLCTVIATLPFVFAMISALPVEGPHK